jgi:flagellum-specific ATP synthase
VHSLSSTARTIATLPLEQRYGRVTAVRGALIEVEGLAGAAQIGARIDIDTPEGMIPSEVTGIEAGLAQCMPFREPQGLRSGTMAWLHPGALSLRPCDGWLGRMVDGLGRPVDGKGELPLGATRQPIKAPPPPAASRARVGERIETGVRALDLFVPLCTGQRLGLFAGSGVGKSVLLSMLARWTECDVAIIGLIGERGREVQEFVEDDLGPEGLARSIVVVATSDEPALMRRPGGLDHARAGRAFPRPRPARAVPDGLGHALCDGAARDRPCQWRAARNAWLYPDRLCGTPAPARTCRPRPARTGFDHRPVHRAGGWRRS